MITLKQAIEKYLLWMIEKGYRNKTFDQAESILNSFVEFVEKNKLPWTDTFTHSTIKAFESEQKDKIEAGRRVRGLWLYLFRHGMVLEPLKKKYHLPEIYEEYLISYSRRVLPNQVQHARKLLSALESYLSEHHITLSSVKISDLDNFLAHHTASFKQEVRRNELYHLRSFLRYLYDEHKILKKDLAHLLVGAPVFSKAKPPKFFRPHEIKKLFDHIKPTTPFEIRAYAMLYLACTLGLRSKEISLISLDDISFSKAEISLCNRKNTLPLTLPLPEDTIKAIAAYLVGVRPKSNHRALFLSLQPPYEPLCSAQVARNVSKFIHKAKLPGSAYWLRHTLAQNLLESGASIFEIKEMLGHEDIQSSEKYLHVHINLMREVILDESL
jgi:integrase/recombinase XerD